MEDTRPKTFVFVLMPFNDDFADIYAVGIKQACKDAGAYCERVDEQIFVENILERTYNQIAKADVIVAEMTGRNPNVFYETGYAHALNKRVILLTQNADDIPFDLKHYPHIIYEGKIATLKSQLEARIRWCIENPKQSLSHLNINLELFVNGISLSDGSIVDLFFNKNVKHITSDDKEDLSVLVNFPVSLHNITNSILDPHSLSLSLIVPETFESLRRERTQLPDKRVICNLDSVSPLFPDSWHTLTAEFYIKESLIADSPFDVLLRLFTAVGPKDYNFKVNLRARA